MGQDATTIPFDPQSIERINIESIFFSYDQLEGIYDFNLKLIGPLGSKVYVHELPQQQATWSPHTIEGYYIGPELDHYICYRTCIPATRAVRIANTIFWMPYYCKAPKNLSEDAAIAAKQDLIHDLNHPAPGSPLAPINNKHVTALRKLTKIFCTVAPKLDETPVPPSVEEYLKPIFQQHPIDTKFTKIYGDVPYKGTVQILTRS